MASVFYGNYRLSAQHAFYQIQAKPLAMAA